MSDGGGDTGGGDTGGGGGSFGGDHGGGAGGGGDWNNRRNDHDYHHGHETDYNDGNGKRYSDQPFIVQLCIPGCFMIIGLLVGIITLVMGIQVKGSYDEVVGEIIGVQSCGCSSSNNNGSCTTTYKPIIEFFVDGQRYEFMTNSCSNPGPKVGNDIKVLFDPDDPSEAVSGNFVDLWLVPAIALSIGIGACCCACTVLYKKFIVRPETSNNFTDDNNENKVETPSAYHSSEPVPMAQPASNPYTPATTASGGGTSLFDQMNSKV
mmetsp:Transcript_15308/g.22437  ORF Transcript_15308/g.22437 Transcript_15308/m.22437 type:complete len:264 (-) Transcript_15308:179-970(-)|eukprot:CAMPEP_0197235322 /NCGR_PEP_ID=MMETSP1429-20130617/2779_1 /TAXON_ID=49237 /ORGANISM="Chaetoceros  sp., Strain UNC1202" /LENGTH=263 /DNA_ID=CAMNT_0042693883 /DNA_START=81 /DNA_END=872 /DNA_ORIENTATION=-